MLAVKSVMNDLIPRNKNPGNTDFSDEVVSPTIRGSSIYDLTVLLFLGGESEH